MIQLGQTPHFTNYQRQSISIISSGRKRNFLDSIGTVLEFVNGVIDRAEGSGGEEGYLVKFSLIAREGEGVGFNGPGGWCLGCG